MNNLKIENSKVFLVKENNIKEILIDFSDFKCNLTDKPLINTVNKQSIIEKYNEIISNIKGEQDYNNIIFTLTLILRKLIGMNRPIKMLEIGSLDGYMSKYFVSLLNYFNNESTLTCVDLFNEQVTNNGIFKFTNSFELYKNNINESGASNVVNTIIGNPIDILDIIEDSSFDIVFINHRYSNSIYINKYINKLKEKGLFIVNLGQDNELLNLYLNHSFDTFMEFTNLDNIITGYGTIEKSEKEFFELESIKNQYKYIYKNILDTTDNIKIIIENVVNTLNINDIEKIKYAINLLNMIENILIQINDEINNIDLKFYTNEVKNSLIDLMFEIEKEGKFINEFKVDLIENKNIWYESIQNEFLDK